MTFPRLLLIAAVALSVGCAATERVAAPVDDYSAYRRTRLQTSLERKLAASWLYLRDFPRGRWRAEVKRWFDAAEPAYRRAAHDRPDLLQRYLALLPDAPGARAASQRLSELRLAAEYRRRREAEFTAKARAFEAELERAADQRRELLRSVVSSIQRLAAFSAWGQRPEGAEAAIAATLGTTPDGRACSEQRCVRRLVVKYAVPEERRLLDRQAIVDLQLELHDDRVVRAALEGPQLFSRLGEAVQVRAIAPDDAQARAEAIGVAVQLLGSALASRLQEPGCAQQPVSPVVLHWKCNDLQVRATAGTGLGEPDRVVIEPTTDASPRSDAQPESPRQ